MIEKSVYEDYEIDFSDTYTSDDAYYFAFNENRELYLENNELISDINDLDVNFSLFIGKNWSALVGCLCGSVPGSTVVGGGTGVMSTACS